MNDTYKYELQLKSPLGNRRSAPANLGVCFIAAAIIIIRVKRVT